MNDLIEPASVSDEIKRRSFVGTNEIARELPTRLIPPGVHLVRDESKVKVRVREYVSSQPEQAALAAMAAGAALTGLLRYLIRRKKSGHPERVTRTKS